MLDGGKALAKATREVFGEQAVIARCRLHYADFRVMPTRRRDASMVAVGAVIGSA